MALIVGDCQPSPKLGIRDEEPGSRPDPVILNGGILDDPNSLTPAMQI